jgi:hypothetical protein
VNQIEKEFEFIRKIYRDVLNGYTSLSIKNNLYYFKHLTDLDQTDCNNIFLKEFTKAKASGLPEEKDKIDILKISGHWSEDKENKIKTFQTEINALNNTKSKLLIKSQIDFIAKKISSIEKELKSLIDERSSILGLTAEDFAKKKSNEYILYITIYKDSDLKSKFFNTLEEFEEIESNELLALFLGYRELLDDLSFQNLKKIAILPFFLNNFFLAKDNPYTFFGKPIIYLTKYQLELFTLGKQYQNILIQSKSTPPNYESLDELVAWYDNQGAINSSSTKINKNKLGNTYVGADKDEVKRIAGADKNTVDLIEEVSKMGKGKDLNFDDLLKIHGEI